MKNINDFIKELQAISSDKRELPLVITCPNVLEVEPKIKMGAESLMDFCDGNITKMVISYE